MSLSESIVEATEHLSLLLREVERLVEQQEQTQKLLDDKQKKLSEIKTDLVQREAKLAVEKQDIVRQKRIISASILSVEEREQAITEREKIEEQKRREFLKGYEEKIKEKDDAEIVIAKANKLREQEELLMKREKEIERKEEEMQKIYAVDRKRKAILDSRQSYQQKERERLQKVAETLKG